MESPVTFYVVLDVFYSVLAVDYFNWTVSFSMERNGQTEFSASDRSQNHDRPFCFKCALLCNR